MKNIHVLPTENSSRLQLQMNGKYHLENGQTISLKSYRNIYITSDEEIKIGDWYLIEFNGLKITQCTSVEELISIEGRDDCKKIILTIDQDLIKDGVQAIDDKFLEWFVKNPSCEFVEVTRNKKLSSKSIWDAKEGDLVFNNHGFGGIIQELSNDVRVHILSENGEGYMEVAITSDNGKDTLIINGYKVYDYTDYKIIIPKEEPKQEILEDISLKYHQTAYENLIKELTKQETLKEAAKEYAENEIKDRGTDDDKLICSIDFIAGAKWQQEQDKNKYSEEEVLEILNKRVFDLIHKKDIKTNKEWFEKLKNK